MSLLNRMLQNLEQQHAGNASETRATAIPEGVRVVAPSAPAPFSAPIRRVGWITLGLLCLTGLGIALFNFKMEPLTTQEHALPAPNSQLLAPAPAVAIQPAPVILSPAIVPAPPLPAPPVAPTPEVVAEIRPRMNSHPAPRRQPRVEVAQGQRTHTPEVVPPVPISQFVQTPQPIKHTTPQQQSDFTYQQALSALRSGRIAEAEPLLTEALQIFPSHSAARQTLTGLLIEQGRHAAAEQHLREGLLLNPRQTELSIPLARLLVDQGRLGKALEVLQRTQALTPDNPDLAGFIGILLQRIGRPGEAITQLQAALKLRPNTGTWWIALGLSLQDAKKPKESLDAFQRALATHDLTAELQTLANQRVHLNQRQTAP